MPERIFGHIPNYPEGSHFVTRAALSEAGLHRPTVAGISGSEKDGADSILLSGGYEDDQDLGSVIVYTGHGGRDQQTRRQISDQLFTRGNRALALSSLNGLPVRVVRGSKHPSPYSPAEGYRYDGLFPVDDYWQDTGRSGFLVWRYRLIKIPDTQRGRESSVQEESGHYGAAPRRGETISRIVRDTATARSIKVLYDHRCQACGIRLETAAGPYIEAAHIRPLGAPHDGPDSADNILCLCPNHHVLFDYGELIIGEDLSLEGEEGQLTVHPTAACKASELASCLAA